MDKSNKILLFGAAPQHNNYVRGPTNAVRLENSIDNSIKTLYLFMDWHIDIEKQTECNNIRSTEFKNYLIDNFDIANKNDPNMKIDFMLAVTP